MTTSHDTAQECAAAFERYADKVHAKWHRLLDIPCNADDPKSCKMDDDGALAASVSAGVLKVGDLIREAVTLLRAQVVRLRTIAQQDTKTCGGSHGETLRRREAPNPTHGATEEQSKTKRPGGPTAGTIGQGAALADTQDAPCVIPDSFHKEFNEVYERAEKKGQGAACAEDAESVGPFLSPKDWWHKYYPGVVAPLLEDIEKEPDE